MKILVLNAGSSSLKFKLYKMPQKDILAYGAIEGLAEESSKIHLYFSNSKYEKEEIVKDHQEALSIVQKLFLKFNILKSFRELDAVGHRVVHGGEAFSKPTIIDDEVIKTIRKMIPLAPLHNPSNLMGIEAMRTLNPKTPQVAIFDTAFHQSMPKSAYRYALPKEWYEHYGVRRYGFHGSSHFYVSRELAKLSQRDIKEINTISLHLGNGASICAIEGGRSVETSMGFTPLEGLVMGSRSGDIDAEIIFYMNRVARLDYEKIEWELNSSSGLKGLCGDNDMRNIQERMLRGDKEAKLAFDIFIHRIVKYIGAYAILLGRLDAIIFTGGIGENSSLVRRAISERLGILGVILNSRENDTKSSKAIAIHSSSSSVELWVIPTDEEGVIAQESYRVLKREKSSYGYE